MTQLNMLELAKQGDTEAIASLMNRHLQPKGITAKASFDEACLHVMLESMQVPNQQNLVAFVRKGLTSLGAASIDRVKVEWQQIDEDFPAWSNEFNLGMVEAELEAVDSENYSDSSQPLTVSIILSGDTTCGLTTQVFESIANNMAKDIFSYCTDFLIQKVSVSNGSFVITKER